MIADSFATAVGNPERALRGEGQDDGTEGVASPRRHLPFVFFKAPGATTAVTILAFFTLQTFQTLLVLSLLSCLSHFSYYSRPPPLNLGTV